MRHRYTKLFLLLLAFAFTAVGCDQSSQNVEPENANRYIITQSNSAVGDADAGTFASNEVLVPDTVSFYVQGFTVDKDYTWTVNGSEVPVEVRSNQSHVWENREGEFVSVMFTPDDDMTEVDQASGATTNTFSVNSPDDDIDTEELEITTSVPTIAGQISRLGDYSTAASLASSSGIADILGEEGPYTLLVPTNAALDALPAVPTQATDDDELPSSSVRADILKYHAIAADIPSGDISDGQAEPTLLGSREVSFSTTNGVSVNDEADVVLADLPSVNGALHAIDAPLLPPTASVDFTDRETGALAQEDTVTVDGSYIGDEGGYIVLHDSTELADGNVIGSIVGHSDYISPNSIANEVKVPLGESISNTTTVGAMAHKDDGNENYDFETSGGTQDAPYTLDGGPVIDYGVLNITD